MEKEVSRQIIEALRGWDDLEGGLGQLKPLPIDYDLAITRSKKTFGYRGAAAEEFKRLSKQVKDDEYMRDTLLASAAYIQHNKYSFKEYVRKTMGFKPRYIDEDKYLSAYKDGTVKSFEKFCKQPCTKESIGAYFKKYLKRGTFVENTYRKVVASRSAKMARQLGAKLNEADSLKNLEFDENASFASWVSADRENGVKIKISTHEDMAWTFGLAKFFAYHEVCAHLVQLTVLMNEIDEGRLDEAYGLICLNQPFYAPHEGVANSMLSYVGGEKSIHVKMWKDYMVLNNAAASNALYLMMAEDEPAGAAADYVMDFFPRLHVRARERVVARLEDIVEHPLWRSYSYQYGPTAVYFSRAAERMNPAQKKSFITRLFRKPMTMKQVDELLRKDYGVKVDFKIL